MPESLDAARLHEAQQSLAELVDNSDAAIVGRSLDNIILSWNQGAERIFGYTAKEALGRHMSVLVPPDRAGELDVLRDKVARGERIENYETVRVAKDGRLVHISLLVVPSRDEHGDIVKALTVSRDITDHVATREALETVRATEDNRALVFETANRVALDILSNRAGIEALRHIADAARTLAGAQYAALGVARVDGTGLTAFVTTGLTPEEEHRIGPRPRGAGILGLLLKRNTPLRVDRLGDHPASAGFPPNHPPMDSFLGVPIRRGDIVLGSLYLTNKIGGANFTEADQTAVEALGAHAAVAIHNLQMLERQQALVRGLINAQEEERRAVAYDLHDGLTQYVMASHAHLESFRRAHETGNEERANREMEQGIRYLKEAVLESRRLVNGLRSLALDDLGLAGALEQLVNEERDRAGWKDADIIHNVAGKRFDRTLETAAYRVAQEALTNARKHAKTDRVQVMLLVGMGENPGASTLTLEVRDWGIGFAPETKRDEYQHFGLHGMVERVHLMGGSYALQSSPGSGTIVHAEFPALMPSDNDAHGKHDSGD
jgi:PAS domain S-box-containing protein